MTTKEQRRKRSNARTLGGLSRGELMSQVVDAAKRARPWNPSNKTFNGEGGLPAVGLAMLDAVIEANASSLKA